MRGKCVRTGEILAAVVAEDHLNAMERKTKMERPITVAFEAHSGVCHLTWHLWGLQKLPL